MLTNGFLKTERLDELKQDKTKQKKPDRVKKYSSVVEDIPHKIGLKMMPVVLTLVFPSAEECQEQKPCIHDELRFISFTECLYSEV